MLGSPERWVHILPWPGRPPPRLPPWPGPRQRPSMYLGCAGPGCLPKALMGPTFLGMLWDELHSARHKVTKESAQQAWWHTVPGREGARCSPPPALASRLLLTTTAWRPWCAQSERTLLGGTGLHGKPTLVLDSHPPNEPHCWLPCSPVVHTQCLQRRGLPAHGVPAPGRVRSPPTPFAQFCPSTWDWNVPPPTKGLGAAHLLGHAFQGSPQLQQQAGGPLKSAHIRL